MLEHLKSHLQGKVVVIGIGNTMRGDDGVGSLLAREIQGKVRFGVFDAGATPENYLGKAAKEKPDTILIIDAVDFSAKPGEFRVLEEGDLKTVNLFSTHNASLSMLINFLKSECGADIMILIIQPKKIALCGELSPEVKRALTELKNWFLGL